MCLALTPRAVSELPELYVAVDVEADGPIPGPFSMISLGMAVTGRADLTFYTELRSISDAGRLGVGTAAG
jgi:hypothetical protein